MVFYATDHDDAAPRAERLINDAGFDPVRTGTLARTEAGHQEPKGDLYGEEFHHQDAVAAVARLPRHTPSAAAARSALRPPASIGASARRRQPAGARSPCWPSTAAPELEAPSSRRVAARPGTARVAARHASRGRMLQPDVHARPAHSAP